MLSSYSETGDGIVEVAGRNSKQLKLLKFFVEELFGKKANKREEALKEIVKILRGKVQHEFVKERSYTLLNLCQKSINHGSFKEINLGCEAIGLLALTVGFEDGAHEIYTESLLSISQLLKSKSEPMTFQKKSKSEPIKIWECLAIVTFVGAQHFEETEEAMLVMWRFINLESENKQCSGPVLAAAISAWSFLLATMDSSRIHHKYWQRVIPYMMKLLEQKNEEFRGVVLEAISLIFEKGVLEKFMSESDRSSCSQELKNEVVNHIMKYCDPKQDILNLFEESCFPKTTKNIHGNRLTFSTWSQLKKINFVKHFLKDGFLKHMLENEFLQHAFCCYPKAEAGEEGLYVPETEEVIIQYFVPDIRKAACSKKMFKSPNSLRSKAKTQKLKKERSLVEARKIGHYAPTDD